ncbi:MAG: hypothetical protein HYU64_03410 [Armatimonadetes bacterium]|nr:hypothetical protein [Armatimonadota bacterium]
MKSRVVIVLILLLAGGVWASQVPPGVVFDAKCRSCKFVNTHEKNGPKELCEKCRYSLAIYPQDKGSNSMDTGGFPAEIQENYKVFARSCSKCHPLARPIGHIPLKTIEEWKKYVIIMVRKPGSGVTLDSGLKVLKLIEYVKSKQR